MCAEFYPDFYGEVQKLCVPCVSGVSIDTKDTKTPPQDVEMSRCLTAA
jgi:hypothetical protein